MGLIKYSLFIYELRVLYGNCSVLGINKTDSY